MECKRWKNSRILLFFVDLLVLFFYLEGFCVEDLIIFWFRILRFHSSHASNKCSWFEYIIYTLYLILYIFLTRIICDFSIFLSEQFTSEKFKTLFPNCEKIVWERERGSENERKATLVVLISNCYFKLFVR